MKTDKLFDAIGEARSEYVQDAEHEVKRANTPNAWVKWVAAAACLLVAVLIAVPALNGKTPEVPNDQAPATEPVDKPANNTDDTEWPSRAERAKAAAEYGLLANHEAAGIGPGYIYTYEMYLEDYAAVTKNPVFAALFESEEVLEFDVTELDAYTEPHGLQTESVTMAKDGFRKCWHDGVYSLDLMVASSDPVTIGHKPEWNGSYDEDYDTAENNGTRCDYYVDGVEVQKYVKSYGSTYYQVWHERLCIDGEWYTLYGNSESDVDVIATALAHVALELELDTSTASPKESVGEVFDPTQYETGTPNPDDLFGDIYTSYSTYLDASDDEKYASVIANPVFKALFESEAAQEVTMTGAYGYAQFARVNVNGASVEIRHNGIYHEDDWTGFATAEQYGVRADYLVAGVEVQKYCDRDVERYEARNIDDPLLQSFLNGGYTDWVYYARVKVAGGWYYLCGYDEASVDAIATALAHIAAQY